MNSIIIVGGNARDREAHITGLLNPKTELIHLFAEKTSITIKQVQDLSIPLSIQARLPRLVWIEQANLLTVPAQNALLKMLEEPPASTNFYLTCDSAASLLPTIRSRCTLVNLLKLQDSLTHSTNLADLKAVMAMSPGDRLAAISKHDRTESIAWIQNLELALKAKLQDPNSSNLTLLAKLARLTQNAHSQFLSNCSVSLVTQNFYLRLPHTHSAR